MPTIHNLGEFVERDGKLYFIKAENLPSAPSKASTRTVSGCAYLLGYGGAFVLMMPLMCLVVLFPIPLFAILVGASAFKFIGSNPQ